MAEIITEFDQRHYAIAIPYIDEMNLLFQIRSDKLSHQPGDICFPGGAIEKGEKPEQAVIRELMEKVSGVFHVPFSFFENTSPKIYEVDWKPVFPNDFPFDKIHGGREYGWRPRKSKIRFYEYQGHVIWGMTSRIIESFVKRELARKPT